MKKATILLIFFASMLDVLAMPAYPKPVFVQTPGGGMYIHLCGDEYMKYGMTTDGYMIIQKNNQWFFSTVDDEGRPSASEFLAEDAAIRDEKTLYFLKSSAAKTPDVFVAKENIRRSASMKRTERGNVTGNRKVLIVLAQFKDVPLSKSQTDFDELFNLPGYAKDGAKGSVHDYYTYASYGQLNLECDVIGPFTTKNARKNYGGNVGWDGRDQNPYALFTEALSYAASRVDLQDYDVDGDGYLDNIHIIYAGYGEEAGGPSDAIWAHESHFEPTIMQGVKIDRYSCAAELRSNHGDGISRIGAHCHEIGHALGAMDFYDVDYDQNGGYSGTGEWDIMASGSWNDGGASPANFNPYVKAYNFGWCEIVDVSEEGTYQLKPSSSDNKILRIETQCSDEYYLLENRQQTSFDASVPGHGLLVYHIDADIDKYISNNRINNTFPQRCFIECASSAYKRHTADSKTYGEINKGGCPFPGKSGKTAFGRSTTPSAYCNDGTYSGVELSQIVENKQDISLYIRTGDDSSDQPDTPDEPYDPNPEGMVVWEEHFDSSLGGAYWKQENISGNTSWTYKKTLGLFASNGYMQLAPVRQLAFGERPTTVSRIIFPLGDIEPDEYVVSLDVAAELKNAVAEVRVGTLTAANSLKHESSWTDLQKEWNTCHARFVVDEPGSSLCIEGTCFDGDVLMIDAIELRKGKATKVGQLGQVSDSFPSAYRIDGVHRVGGNARCLYIKLGKKYLQVTR